MWQRPSESPPPSRDNFVAIFAITAIVGYTLILGYDLAHSWGLL